MTAQPQKIMSFHLMPVDPLIACLLHNNTTKVHISNKLLATTICIPC